MVNNNHKLLFGILKVINWKQWIADYDVPVQIEPIIRILKYNSLSTLPQHIVILDIIEKLDVESVNVYLNDKETNQFIYRVTSKDADDKIYIHLDEITDITRTIIKVTGYTFNSNPKDYKTLFFLSL